MLEPGIGDGRPREVEFLELLQVGQSLQASIGNLRSVETERAELRHLLHVCQVGISDRQCPQVERPQPLAFFQEDQASLGEGPSSPEQSSACLTEVG